MNGLLLTAKKSSVSSSGEGNRVKFVDVVPLFHLGHGLSPMLEVALLQVSLKHAIKQTNFIKHLRKHHNDHDLPSLTCLPDFPANFFLLHTSCQ